MRWRSFRGGDRGYRELGRDSCRLLLLSLSDLTGFCLVLAVKIEESIVFGFVDTSTRCTIRSSAVCVIISIGKQIHHFPCLFLCHSSKKVQVLAIRVNRPQSWRHKEQLRMIPKPMLVKQTNTIFVDCKLYVFIFISRIFVPYFRSTSVPRIAPSNAFNADMLSAHLQLIGTLGWGDPSKVMALA